GFPASGWRNPRATGCSVSREPGTIRGQRCPSRQRVLGWLVAVVKTQTPSMAVTLQALPHLGMLDRREYVSESVTQSERTERPVPWTAAGCRATLVRASFGLL